ncbi:unnamed protein product [Caenorhabditis brenneri]
MNRIVQYGSVEAIPYYNCSRKTFSEWEATGVKKPWFGYPLIAFGVFIELLYIPIIYIIIKTKLIKHPCYKIIIMLAMIDMSATCCSCLITGPLLVIGSVFCMYPTFTYITGGLTLNTWCMACAATVSLFINRIISIGFREYADVVEKKLAYSSIAFVLFYGFYIFYFTPSLAYNSDIMAWLPDPLSEETPSKEAAAMGINITVQKHNPSVEQLDIRDMYVCTVLCVLHDGQAVGKGTKVKGFESAPWILAFGQICWACNHACPAIIYVTMNDTIRREFYRLVFRVHVAPKVEDTTSAKSTSKI